MTYTPRQVRSAILALVTAIFIGAIDQTIVAVAIPQISADLGDTALVAWIMSGFMLSAAIAMPVFGKMGDIYGRRRMLYIAILIFIIASVLCAVATDMKVLIGGRILQGIGGGGLITSTQGLIADLVSPKQRGVYQGYISATFAAASAAGPLLGGILTAHVSWRWVFWINLPMGAIALLVAHNALAVIRQERIVCPLDYAGSFLLVVFLSSLLVPITRAGQGAALFDGPNSVLYVILALSLWLLYTQERRCADPVLPLRFFASATINLSCALMFVVFALIASLSVLIPLEAQMVYAMRADEAAAYLLPLALGVPAGSYTGGVLATRTGRYKRILVFGALAAAACMYMLQHLDASNSGAYVACLFATGTCFGMQLPTSLVAVQNTVAHRDVGVITGIIIFFRSFGAAVGVTLLLACFLFFVTRDLPAAPGATLQMGLLKDILASGAGSAGPIGRSVVSAFDAVANISFGLALLAVPLTLFLPDRQLKG